MTDVTPSIQAKCPLYYPSGEPIVWISCRKLTKSVVISTIKNERTTEWESAERVNQGIYLYFVPIVSNPGDLGSYVPPTPSAPVYQTYNMKKVSTPVQTRVGNWLRGIVLNLVPKWPPSPSLTFCLLLNIDTEFRSIRDPQRPVQSRDGPRTW